MIIAETSLQPTTPVVSAVRPHHLREWEESAVAPTLALANVASLRGREVLEALAGQRLEQLNHEPSPRTGKRRENRIQYATGAVQGLLEPLEPVAAGGGWWCSGLDPLADWAPMEWGCFKPDHPRRDEARNRPRKYEHPIGAATRSFWLRVPADVAAAIAAQHSLTLPADVAADITGAGGAFWRWWALEPALPLVITEGAKKAAALLSVGVPAVALPGVDSGAKRTGEKGHDGRRTGPVELLEDLAAVPLAGRPCWVLFDYSDSDRGRRNVTRAARRLGWKLKAAGADVLVGCCPGPAKGADDHLAAGGTWEQLAKCCRKVGFEPVLPHLRAADVTAAAGLLLENAAPIPAPELAPMVAMAAPMGTGKTRAAAAAVAPHLRDGVPVLNLTHRASLGQGQAKELGVAWMARPGSIERLQGPGLSLCFDSCCPSSGLRIRPTEWNGPDGRGPVVVVDEVCQGIEHLLFSHGTAIAGRRVEVLETVAYLLRHARQVVAADAQLSSPILHLLESLTGHRAHLIASDHRPFSGRRFYCPEGLTTTGRNSAAMAARAKLAELIDAGRPFLCWTTAQQTGSKNSAQNLARLHLQRCPGARVLVLDSEHPEDTARLAANPAAVAAEYDAIYCSPALSSGVSIELTGHFAAVLLLSGGTVAPEHVAQAAARVRDSGCPVFCFAPERSPGDHLRVGSGDTDPAQLLRHLGETERLLLADLIAAGGWQPETNNPGPWLRCWAELAAARNRSRLAYSATVRGLCEREGWEVVTDIPAPDVAAASAASMDLEAIATEAQNEEDAAVINAAAITDTEADKLQQKRRRTRAERAQLARWELARRWGLSDDTRPTPELLEADRDGLSTRARFGWLLLTPAARELAAAHDAHRRQQLAPDGRAWSPDLARELLGHRLKAADALGLARWLQRSDWFAADDPELQQLQAVATTHRASITQQLGVTPGARATTTLRSLLRTCGYRLDARRVRSGGRTQVWVYQVAPETLPIGAELALLQTAWQQQLSEISPGGGGVKKTSISNREVLEPPPLSLPEPLDPRPAAAAALVAFFEMTQAASDADCLALIVQAGVHLPSEQLLLLRNRWRTSTLTPVA